jgi:hypothetical protein
MGGKSSKKIDHIDYKITAFEVKKRTLFTPYNTRSETLNPLGLKLFALHKLEAFDIVLEN